jgi:hypothetical protein
VTIAVIFVPAHDIAEFGKQCMDYCAARGYEVAGVIRGDWNAAISMTRASSATVVVIASWDHLDPDRKPRVEVAAPGAAGSKCGDGSSARASLRHRRAHRI